MHAETYPVDDASAAYDSLKGEGLRAMVAVLACPQTKAAPSRTVRLRATEPAEGRIRVALVGAGSFAEGTHVPNLLRLRSRFQLRAVMSRTGTSAKALAERNEAAYATTEYGEILADPEVDLVLIATRHDTHSPLALRAPRPARTSSWRRGRTRGDRGILRRERRAAAHDRVQPTFLASDRASARACRGQDEPARR
jgi:hypothetical protein